MRERRAGAGGGREERTEKKIQKEDESIRRRRRLLALGSRRVAVPPARPRERDLFERRLAGKTCTSTDLDSHEFVGFMYTRTQRNTHIQQKKIYIY